MKRATRRGCALAVAIAFAVSACGDESNGNGASGGAAGANTTAQGGAVSSGGASVSAGQSSGAGASSEGGASEVGTGGGAVANGGQTAAAGAGGSAGESAGGAPSTGFECSGSGERFASGVVSYEFGDGQSFGQEAFPAPVLGPPRGAGCCAGSMDVTSLGDGGFVVLAFANNVIVDGDGADFLVFENAFVPMNAAPESVFAEIATVSVSQDGVTWFDFPCARTKYPYDECAGWHPALANADQNDIDATDPSLAGGDAFDLSELGLAWARYVRIQDRPEADGGVGTFDLDAVSIVHPGCP